MVELQLLYEAVELSFSFSTLQIGCTQNLLFLLYFAFSCRLFITPPVYKGRYPEHFAMEPTYIIFCHDPAPDVSRFVNFMLPVFIFDYAHLCTLLFKFPGPLFVDPFVSVFLVRVVFRICISSLCFHIRISYLTLLFCIFLSCVE